MMDEDKVEVIIICKDHKVMDQLRLAAQWPEDRESYKRLITPTNLSEIPLADSK